MSDEVREAEVVLPVGYGVVGTFVDAEHAERMGEEVGVPVLFGDEDPDAFASPEEAEAWVLSEAAEIGGFHPGVRVDVVALVPVRAVHEGGGA